MQTRERIEDDRDSCGGRPASAVRLEQIGQAAPGHVVHYEVRLTLVVSDVHDAHDVWMVDARRDARFLEQHLTGFAAAAEMRAQHLDGEQATKAAVAGDAGEVNGSHAAASEARQDLVATELWSSSHRARRRRRGALD